jgi:L-lysine 6-oxidase
LQIKKAAWFDFSEQKGNLLFGEDNRYKAQDVPLRNPDEDDRQTLILDPGPRILNGKIPITVELDDSIESQKRMPINYPINMPISEVAYGEKVTSLGTLEVDDKGLLIVYGGYGKAGGNLPLESYGGANLAI